MLTVWAAPGVSYLPYERWGWAQEAIDHGARQAEHDPSSASHIERFARGGAPDVRAAIARGLAHG